MKNVLFYSCRSSFKLAGKIVQKLEQSLEPRRCGFFGDGEIKIRLVQKDSNFNYLQGATVVLFACPRADAQENWLEVFGTIKGLVRKGINEIIPVFPFLGYRRQDKESKPGEIPLLELIPEILSLWPVKDAIIGELHNLVVTQKLFSDHGIKIHEVNGDRSFHTICGSLLENPKVIIASPDKGRLTVVRLSAAAFNKDTIESTKNRPKDDQSDVKLEDVDLTGKIILVRDDEVNTFGTMGKNVVIYKERGAVQIIGFSYHGIFSGDAVDLIEEAPIDRLYVSTTITFPYEKGNREDPTDDEKRLGIESRCGKICFFDPADDFKEKLTNILQEKGLCQNH